MLLAGDIGGTKVNLAIYSPEGGPKDPLHEKTFSSAKYSSLESVVEDFLKQTDQSVEYAAFGVAGPVIEGCADITNLDWEISEAHIKDELGLESVLLLNDLTATASAIPYLDENDHEYIAQGEAEPEGTIAVIAPGTGLGEAYLTWDGQRYRAHPSEGGHVDFAPTSALEFGLLRFLMDRFGHVSYERICSGSGIPNIYQYFKVTGYAPEPEWLKEKLESVDDPTPIIMEAGISHIPECELCRATINTFVTALGAETGNVALKFLATGGIYLGGGIPPRILPLLKSEKFYYSYRNKGRFEDILEKIPVTVILNPKAALIGAAAVGLQRLQGT
jgi:glucokinase